MAELLLDTELDAHQRKYAMTARSSGETLLILLNEILDFAKIEAGMLELERVDFDLCETIESSIAVIAHRCVEKRLELICFTDPRIPSRLWGDPARLRQILTNLTNNAVKFTEQGEVVVEALLMNETGGRVDLRLSVRDTGIGIPRERFDRLFQPFSQLDASTTRKYGGTGLGLTICRQLCNLMGGQIEVESEVGRGSNFWFTLALEKATEGRDERRFVPAELQCLRVLVVESNATGSNILVQQLVAWGFQAETACDGDNAIAQAARAVAEKTPFRVVLFGANVLGMPPEDLIAAIRTVPSLSETIFMMLVPLGQQVDVPYLQSIGVADYVTKPVMPSELFNTLVRVLGVGKGRDLALAGESDPLRNSFPQSKCKGARILVAEDNEINQDVVVMMLTKAGYRCEVVANGKLAVEATRRTSFDAVLMDCHMPEMDGFEATKVILRHEQQGQCAHPGKIPIIALTANAMKADRQQCLDAGMSDYLSKPLDPLQLIDKIDAWITKYNAPELVAPTAPSNPSPGAGDPEAAPIDATRPFEPVLDVEALLRRCSGDLETAERLIGKFQEQLPRDLSQIAASIGAKDAESLAMTAHGLKGAAATIATEPLRRIAARLEAAGRAANLEQAAACLQELQEERDRLFVELPRLLAEVRKGPLEGTGRGRGGVQCVC